MNILMYKIPHSCCGLWQMFYTRANEMNILDQDLVMLVECSPPSVDTIIRNGLSPQTSGMLW